MKATTIRTFDTRHCGVVEYKNLTLYVSYGTVVGVDNGSGPIFTDKNYSPTTTRHTRECLRPEVGPTLLENHADFVVWCANLGLRIRRIKGVRDVESPIAF